ncbi:Receptor-like protein 43 [Linum perenne]
MNVLLVWLSWIRFCCYGAYAAGCNQVEREALLEFKADFQDPSSRLSSWVNGSTDCCKWPGVVCDNVTGHVTQLRLQCPYFRIQEYMLKELSLRAGGGDYVLYADSLQWLSGLPALEYLDLSGVDLSSASEDSIFIQEFLPFELTETLTDRIGKFKRLYRLNLNDNSISGPLPMSFGELASLNSVNLARNQINGTIPASFGRIEELEVVDISHNLLEGIVSSEIHFANLKNLNTFKAAGNRIVLKAKSDWVPPKRLSVLDLSSWYIGPDFPKWLLQSVQHLKSLDLSNSVLLPQSFSQSDLRNASKLYLCYFLRLNV